MSKFFFILSLCLFSSSICFAEPLLTEDKETLTLTAAGGALSDIDTQGVLAELTATAVLLSTEESPPEKTWAMLDEQGLDLDTSRYIEVRAYDTQITLPKRGGETLKNHLRKCAAEAKITPRALELARTALLERSEQLEEAFEPELIEEKRRLLKTVTLTQAQNHYNTEWRKTLPEQVHCEASCNESAEQITIDGKILMSNPRWYETRWYGQMFGVIMWLTSAALFAAAFFLQPFVSAFGIFTLFTGVYFTALPYYDDPEYIQEKRKEDLRRGFLHSYKNGRADKTLTPSERRALLISGILEYGENYPTRLKNFPIAWLSDVLNLHEKVLKETLHNSEVKELQNLKDEFINARNRFKFERNELEDELVSLLKPHQILRDIALDNTRCKYEADSYVAGLRKLQGELGDKTDSIWELWRQKKISSEERDRQIDETNSYYKELMNDKHLVAQVKRAREILELEQERILSSYHNAERNCKELLRYDERMHNIESGMWGLYARYSDYLTSYVKTLKVYDSDEFPDYLDLR